MPLTSTVIGVPSGPSLGEMSTVMSIEKFTWVSSRSPCCSTMSCPKPKSSGAMKVAVRRPSRSERTLAISIGDRLEVAAVIFGAVDLPAALHGSPDQLEILVRRQLVGGHRHGVPAGPFSGATLRRPTKPSRGRVMATSGPSCDGNGAASASIAAMQAKSATNSASAAPRPDRQLLHMFIYDYTKVYCCACLTYSTVPEITLGQERNSRSGSH